MNDLEVQQAREVYLKSVVELEARKGERNVAVSRHDADVAAAQARVDDETAVLRKLVDGRKSSFEDFTAPPTPAELTRIRKAAGINEEFPQPIAAAAPSVEDDALQMQAPAAPGPEQHLTGDLPELSACAHEITTSAEDGNVVCKQCGLVLNETDDGAAGSASDEARGKVNAEYRETLAEASRTPVFDLGAPAPTGDGPPRRGGIFGRFRPASELGPESF